MNYQKYALKSFKKTRVIKNLENTSKFIAITMQINQKNLYCGFQQLAKKAVYHNFRFEPKTFKLKKKSRLELDLRLVTFKQLWFNYNLMSNKNGDLMKKKTQKIIFGCQKQT
ncbi:hypothetical protein BpHYR1_002948 [Brachionus plicatilis]|uniref:Uncharacterized protein n=1 Tax=Brachionus plicatilis TaxID=10195 RepID=A0A3M7T505_BRAPC|nr:hypothetical protein BpHYR1_002948 [Brachionus plicatilis]